MTETATTQQTPLVIGSDEEQVTRSVKFNKAQNHKRFNALFVLPKEKSYENLETDERVIFFIYRHPIVMFKKIAVGALLILVPILALFAVTQTHDPFGLKLTLFLCFYWYCFVIFYFLAVFVSYRSDVFIVTNERIIDFDLYNLMTKEVDDADLGAIHDIKHEGSSGVFRAAYNVGDITLTMPSKELVMKNLPEPGKLALAIGEVVEEAKLKKPAAA